MVRTGRVTNEEEVYLLLNPKQKLAWKNFTDPNSDTFGIGYRSALKAGFADGYAKNIVCTDWWKHRVLRMNLLGKAERVLNKTLSMETQDAKGAEQADLLRVQNDAAKFIAKTQGKDEGYNERTEVTGANGSPIIFMPAELIDKHNLEVKKEEVVEDIINNEIEE